MIDPALLPSGLATRRVATATGLDMAVIEAGRPGAPLVVLLHGFPELAFSWRRVMAPLAAAGFHVVAPDQRGYGATTGWRGARADVADFAMPRLVADVLGLVQALGADRVHAVIGHDFGSPVAAWASLLRPDVFTRAVCLSAPFGGPPGLAQGEDPVHAALAALDPPRRHYQAYYTTPEAARDMDAPPGGLGPFLRAYFHMKSADWPNAPHRLAGWEAAALAEMPDYYIMPADRSMPEAVAPAMPQTAPHWLSDAELAVYVAAFGATGFQPALNWYRCAVGLPFRRDLAVHAGRGIDVPLTFIAGAEDWGWAQVPGALDRMEAMPGHRETRLIKGAGHWVQQEQPEAVTDALLDALA